MADTSLFKRLGRLFSSDVIIRNIGGDQLKVADVNQIQTTGKYETNSLVDRFSRLYIHNNKNIFNPNLNYQTLRIHLYADYEAMDTDPIIASTLDIIADEASLKNDMGEVLSIKSSDENIQKVLYNLFYDVLNIEFNLWSWTRNMCKYGDFFLKLEIAEEFGVYNVLPYTVYHMTRHEGHDPENPSKVSFQLDPDGLASSQDPNYTPKSNKRVVEFDNYEVAHFRLISDTNFLPYGRSFVEPARKIYKQLTLMEDAMLIHRIMRAPEKRTFYVNVGQIPPNEVEQFMQKTINTMKKTPYVDPNTGDYNLRFNMMNMMEDFYLPVRGGDTSTKIETTKGLEYDGTNDIEYLRDKMFAALKVPKAYFGYEGDLSGKATLAAEDIRFARTVERIQRILESELTKIALVHLYAQGFKGESLTNFEISLTNPSIIFEQEKVALLKEKVDLASQMLETKLFPTDYIYDNIFNLSEDSYMEMRDLIAEDKKRLFRITQIENEGNDPAKSGKSYGTPHDLASLYGRRMGEQKGMPFGSVPPGYEDTDTPGIGKIGPEGGRPRVHASHYGTNDGLGGRDPLGTDGMKGGFASDNENVNESDNSSKVDNTLARTLFYQNKDIFKNDKQIIFENKEEIDDNLLNEDQIHDLDN
jgi:hypothetical protein|tara:strand:- start:1925 stop:3850 length:1926 start_codon:yes stop_codon:yes gene_type:complete